LSELKNHLKDLPIPIKLKEKIKDLARITQDLNYLITKQQSDKIFT